MQEITWKIFLQSDRNRKYFYASLTGFAVMIVCVISSLAYIEKREGFVIEDWSLPILGTPRDFSIPVFSITYLAILYAIITTARQPKDFLRLINAYVMLELLRTTVLLLVPLNPPSQTLPLQDPVLQYSFYAGTIHLKDLFFSGHVATVSIAALFARRRSVQMLFWILSAATAFMLVQQRVHYIIDVLAAPLFTFIAFRLSSLIARSSSDSAS